MKRFLALLIAFLVAVTAAVGGDGNVIADNQAHLASAPAKDKTLWQYRIAASALREGKMDIAKAALDYVLARVAENYGAPNTDAAKSRRITKRESDKPFVGEPYERAMANYYRAIIYWADGDLENARALLRNAQLMDSDTVDKTYSGDYILFDYLEGLIEAKCGNAASAAAALSRARVNGARQERATLPDYDHGANVLIFVEYGDGPLKHVTNGKDAALAYELPAYPCKFANLKIGDRIIELPPYDDIGFQAITRGGRLMDEILSQKKSFAKKSLVAALLLGDPVLATISRIISSNAKPDTRCWNNLPRFLSFVALKLPPGHHEAEISFYDPLGRKYTTLSQQITMDIPDSTTLPPGAGLKDVVIYCSQLRN